MSNSKIDLFWIIPELIAGFGIIIAAAMYIDIATEYVKVGEIWLFIFHMALVMIVLELGINTLCKGLKEFQEIFAKRSNSASGRKG